MGTSQGRPVLRSEDISALSESSGLEKAKIIEMFNSFISENPSGKMRRKDFKELMSKALPQKNASKMEKHVFRIYDSNGDGQIDFGEFMMAFHIMSSGTHVEVLRKIFRVFDVNCDGSITKKEMNKLVGDMFQLLRREDPNISDQEKVVKNAFTEMDQNGDGKITEEEFVKACLDQKEISKLLALKVIDMLVDET